MEVSFGEPNLGAIFRNAKELRRRHGAVRAKKVQQRLEDLDAAETLAVMRQLPGRCHELSGDLAGCLALDLDHPYRLLIRPADDGEPGLGGGLDWSAVRSVIVIGIVDYH